MRLKNKILAAGCVVAAAAALVTGLACNEHEIAPFSKSLSAGKMQNASSGSARAVDILFVIDNSNSMEEEQRDLDNNFGLFLEKLIAANADFNLAVVSTEWPGNTNVQFVTDALKAGKPGRDILKHLGDPELDKIASECKEYFGDNKKWISSSDFDSNERMDKVRTMFRCESMLGLSKGVNAGVERGLATMEAGLMNNKKFKREGSILSVVFVTDENDCSDVYNDDGSGATRPNNINAATIDKCESARNIEDSCTMSREDRITRDPITHATSLRLSPGSMLEYEGESKSVRDWCVQGDEKARSALIKAYDDCENTDDPTTCREDIGINCPKGGCTNGLNSRDYFYKKIIDLMIESNKKFYEQQNAEIFKDKKAEEKEALMVEMAKADVIIANIINRDLGIRFEGGVNDAWCGNSGNQSYRYQLFGEMFQNDPIFAPICCRREGFYTAKSEEDASDNANEVCNADWNGANAKFGPVLGTIGKRIGEAINTLCTETAPLICDPADCNEPGEQDGEYTNTPLAKPKTACPCLHGCNTKQYFSNSDREYHLCNEFRLNVGTVDKDAEVLSSEDKTYTPYKVGTDYEVDYESNYCYSRTGSPIQINLNKSDANKMLVIEYPKRVSAKK